MRSADPSEWVDRYGDYLYRFAMLRVRDRSLAAILKHKIIDHIRRHWKAGPAD